MIEWSEKNVRSEMRPASASYSEMEGLQASNAGRVGDGCKGEHTSGGNGGGKVEDFPIFVRSYKNGQYQEFVHQRPSAGVTGLSGNARSKTGVLWTCTGGR